MRVWCVYVFIYCEKGEILVVYNIPVCYCAVGWWVTECDNSKRCTVR